MNSIIRIKVSEGEDREAIRIKIQQLIDFSGWQLRDENTISKTYHVTTYTKAVDLLTTIATRSKSKSHHAKMILKAFSLTVEWTTHKPPGLSEKDTYMAGYCDERAKEIGTVLADEAPSCKGPKV